MTNDVDQQARTTRPALDVLDRDQDRLLYEGDDTREPRIEPLTDGFSTYWMALSWYQAAGVRTLGHVERVIEPRDMLPLSGVLEHLFQSATEPESVYLRRRTVESLGDACDLAYRQFRERANERVSDESGETWEDVDPEKERNPLMRPAFRRLDRSQSGALIELWDGFETREKVGKWARSLTVPTHGETRDGFIDEIVSSPAMLGWLLDRDSREAKLMRYRFAVSEVLPAYLSAARTLHGGERTDAPEEESKTWRKG